MPFFAFHSPHPIASAVLCCLALMVAGGGFSASAQAAGPASDSDSLIGAAPPAPTHVAQPALVPASHGAAAAKPEWKDVPPAQQRALQPLAAIWHPLSEIHKRKWLAISANFDKLPAAEQTKLQERMREWVLLSPAQRNQARLNFAEAKQLSPTEKQAKWQAYQALSAEEKEKLAGRAPKPRVGAATTIKPVPKQKLVTTTIDPAKKPPSQTPALREAPATMRKVDRNTLLPQQP